MAEGSTAQIARLLTDVVDGLQTITDRLDAIERRLHEHPPSQGAAPMPERSSAADRRARKAKRAKRVKGAARDETERRVDRALRAAPGQRDDDFSLPDADFAALVDDKTVGVAEDFDHDSDVLLLAFGGMARYIGIPPFEFFSLTEDMPTKRMFIRDLFQCWYHLGVPGAGGTIEEMRDYLRAIIDEQGVRRLVVAGNSSGGYAALLFGTMLGADEVLAFSPQTVLERAWLDSVGDARWNQRLDRLDARGGPDRRYTELDKALPALHDGRTRCHVHFADAANADSDHALRLQGVQGVELHEHPRGGHSLIKLMRESGELQELLVAATTG